MLYFCAECDLNFVKRKFQFEREEDFSMIGIVSPKPVFKVAFLLNQYLHLQLTKIQDLDVQLGLSNFPDTFFFDNIHEQYFLFTNQQPVQTRKSRKSIDYPYFFIMHPTFSEKKISLIQKQICSIPEITVSSIIEKRKEVINLLNLIL